MTLMLDTRVPIVFGNHGDAQDGDAVLTGVSDGALGHDVGCACCIARTPVAQALSRLFMQRARGEVAFFRRVLVNGHDAEAAVRAALATDPVAAARFRLI